MPEQPTDIRIELATLLSQVDQSNAITADKMQQLQAGLEGLWAKTDGDDEAHAIILQTWDQATQLAEQNTALTFQVIASGNIAQAALAEAKVDREKLEGIEEALAAGDEDHPALSDFAFSIREYAAEEFDEWMNDEGWPEAMAEAYEEIRGEVVEKVHRLSGGGLSASNKFVAVLMGRRAQFTAEQTAMFAAFMETFEEMVQAEATNGA